MDNNFAVTFAGSGGVLAGASASGTTSTISNTSATIGAGSLVDLTTRGTGILLVAAEHTATFNSQEVTIAGGVLAGAGVTIVNSVDSTVNAGVADNVVVHAKDIEFYATNHADKQWLAADNVNGTTGGLVSGAGVSSDTNITFNTLVTVGTRPIWRSSDCLRRIRCSRCGR